MLNMIRADLFKICKSSTIKIFFAITSICAIVMITVTYLMAEGKISTDTTGIWFLFSDVNVIGILGAVIAGVFICGDFDNKTIHEAVTCGCSRVTIIVSKVAVFFSAVIFILLPYGIATGIALNTGAKFNMGASMGLLNLLIKSSGSAYQASDIFKLIIIILTLMIVYAAQMSVCVPLALVIKKPAAVIAINYGFQVLCGQLLRLKDRSDVFDNIYSGTPFGGTHCFLTMGSGTGDIIKAISVSLMFIIIMIAVTYSIFRKSEIK